MQLLLFVLLFPLALIVGCASKTTSVPVPAASSALLPAGVAVPGMSLDAAEARLADLVKT